MNPQVVIKPGVLFASTPIGAMLLDVARDRFVVLRPLSAAIWSRCADGAPYEALLKVIETNGFDRITANRILRLQLGKWQEAGLMAVDQIDELPVTTPADPGGPRLEFLPTKGRVSLLVAAEVIAAERRYRRLLKSVGLARTLIKLQQEMVARREQDQLLAVSRILCAYHFLRRPFKQGATSRDCLLRSLTLLAVLRAHGIAGDLCIGIIALPFESHAWVEREGYVLNDSVKRVDPFTAIARF